MLGFFLIAISLIFIPLSKILGMFYNILIDLLLFMTEFTSKLPFSRVYVKTPYIYQIILYYIFLVMFVFLSKTGKIQKVLKFKKQIIAIILIIVLIPNLFEILPQRNLKIYFIDVGQGDSCLLVTPNNVKILIDGGGSENYDIRKNTLLPYLLNRRINKIDYMFISHFDTDHSRTG